MNKQINKYCSAFMFLLLMFTIPVYSQNQSIGLDQAIAIARKNNVGLKRDQLISEQKKMLGEAGILQNAASLYFSGEEFDFNRTGVHSINIEQSFYLPKAVKAQKGFYQSAANLAEKNAILTSRALKWEVSKAYYQLLFFKQEEDLLHQTVHFYEDFLEKTELKIKAGESGKIPKLAAQTNLGQARLELEHNEEQYQVAFILFNSWLQSDTLYDVTGKLNSDNQPVTPDSIFSTNVHLELNKARIDLANAEVSRKESLMLPQINSGLKLQSVEGEIPFFGYQLGINVPLFKKSYKQHVQAAKLAVKVEEMAMESSKLQLERTVRELRFRLEHQLHVLFYLKNELEPIAQERHDINTQAYEAGEINYLDSLAGLEDLYKVQLQYLESLLRFQLLKTELEYWTTH